MSVTRVVLYPLAEGTLYNLDRWLTIDVSALLSFNLETCSRTCARGCVYHAKCAPMMLYCAYEYTNTHRQVYVADGCSTLHKRARVRSKSSFLSEKALLLHRLPQQTSWFICHISRSLSRLYLLGQLRLVRRD